jgi:hypothetical protein
MIPILQRLPVGWTITFSRAEVDLVEIDVTGWFPHYPRTSGERRVCKEYAGRITIMARELELSQDDLLQRETGKLVDRVIEDVRAMRRQLDPKPEEGGS